MTRQEIYDVGSVYRGQGGSFSKSARQAFVLIETEAFHPSETKKPRRGCRLRESTYYTESVVVVEDFSFSKYLDV